MTIKDLKPTPVWQNFEKLTHYPRPSEHEEKVRAFLTAFGKNLGLETIVDEIGNVIIRKPATPGMEDRRGVILQAHMDMVPQKNNDVKHDFLNDPITPRIVGDWVYATGTTLGADDGMGVAAAMAILESRDIPHGPIEALFTTDEETGMTGARGLKPGVLKGDILLNLDSEEEGELYVGCAGGIDGAFEFAYTTEPVPAGMEAYHIHLTGLKGGHSGMDINLGRGNANKVMMRVLLPMMENCGVRLAHIEGGNLRNAIPREADAIVCIPAANTECAKAHVADVCRIVRAELGEVDPGLVITIEPCAMPENVIEAKVALQAIRAIRGALNGVYTMWASVPGFEETSSNLAIVKSENGILGIYCLLRGLGDSGKTDMGESMAAGFKAAGATCSFSGAYCGWKPNPDSVILHLMQETYHKLFGKDPKVMAIHAGLECGILGGAYPNWDMISFGPSLRSPHSPEERCFIPSVQKFWDLLLETLKNIPRA